MFQIKVITGLTCKSVKLMLRKTMNLAFKPKVLSADSGVSNQHAGERSHGAKDLMVRYEG